MSKAETVLEKINNGREKIEACFVFSCWADPDLFEDYKHVNATKKDHTLQNPDAEFYWNLGKAMYKQGIRNFDAISIDTFLTNKEAAKKKFEEFGGMETVNQLRSLIDVKNVDAYFDKIAKMNSLSMIYKKYKELFADVDRFESASNEDVYNTFELLNNSVVLNTNHSEHSENLVIDQQFLNELESGNSVGFSYNKFAPLLNYITLGGNPGSLFMVGGHSGTGKSSFVFEVQILGMHYSGIKTAIISNEMKSDIYKVLLLEHILTVDLNYYGLTRKQIKMGKWTDEQKEKIAEASKISEEKYKDIIFIKTFDNDIGKIIKYIRRLKSQGVQAVFYDTFKSDDGADEGAIWQSLTLDARRLFQTCDKLNILCITTYQLALHTLNQRYLDASCLSNAKQIKEVYETMVYFRPLWDDEYPGEKNDVHPYRINRDNHKIHDVIDLDPKEKYYLLFIDKTRADEDKQVLIFRWRSRFNEWKELGFANVRNDHRSF